MYDRNMYNRNSPENIHGMSDLVGYVARSKDPTIRTTFNKLLNIVEITNPESISLDKFVEKCYNADAPLLREFFKMLEIHFCDTCGRAFVDGYRDDRHYYCENPYCFPYTEEKWEDACNGFEDVCYWAHWECSHYLVFLYNNLASKTKSNY